jgi:hypothetical protein
VRLIQFKDNQGVRKVGMVAPGGESVRAIIGVASVYELAQDAIKKNTTLEAVTNPRLSFQSIDYNELLAQKRVLPPLDHPDAARCLITGTGLSHLGSAAARDAMHVKIQKAESELTDSMKIFKWGVEGGKPAPGQIGVQPEWFYKGDGRCVIAPEHALDLPPYANDGGEEVEVVGLYIIGPNGAVHRAGFALGNEYADHVMERKNYLYLAHSKLRQCAYGPELVTGVLPNSVSGHARLLREGKTIWESDWLSGEDNMAHSIANLEHHHFKYADFRRPGDVHVHFFGAATGSFTQNVKAHPGDVFEIAADAFGKPLRNPLARGTGMETLVTMRQL